MFCLFYFSWATPSKPSRNSELLNLSMMGRPVTRRALACLLPTSPRRACPSKPRGRRRTRTVGTRTRSARRLHVDRFGPRRPTRRPSGARTHARTIPESEPNAVPRAVCTLCTPRPPLVPRGHQPHATRALAPRRPGGRPAGASSCSAAQLQPLPWRGLPIIKKEKVKKKKKTNKTEQAPPASSVVYASAAGCPCPHVPALDPSCAYVLPARARRHLLAAAHACVARVK